MYRLITVSAGALIVALLALGCGGGEDAATARASKAQFMKQAEKLCAATQEDLQKLILAEKATPETYKQIASVMNQQAKELEAIPRPEEVDAKVESLTASIEKVAGIIARDEKDALEDPQIARYKKEATGLQLPEC